MVKGPRRASSKSLSTPCSESSAKRKTSTFPGSFVSLSVASVITPRIPSLPISKLSAFCAELELLLEGRYPDCELCLFGHIGDGNLHVNIMKPESLGSDAFLAKVHDVDRDMFALVRAHKGSVSAEHGVGLLKREWLEYTRSAVEIDLMRHLKATLDPLGLLNPGKVL